MTFTAMIYFGKQFAKAVFFVVVVFFISGWKLNWVFTRCDYFIATSAYTC